MSGAERTSEAGPPPRPGTQDKWTDLKVPGPSRNCPPLKGAASGWVRVGP